MLSRNDETHYFFIDQNVLTKNGIEINEINNYFFIPKLQNISSFRICHRVEAISIFILTRVKTTRRMRWSRHISRIG